MQKREEERLVFEKNAIIIQSFWRARLGQALYQLVCSQRVVFCEVRVAPLICTLLCAGASPSSGVPRRNSDTNAVSRTHGMPQCRCSETHGGNSGALLRRSLPCAVASSPRACACVARQAKHRMRRRAEGGLMRRITFGRVKTRQPQHKLRFFLEAVNLDPARFITIFDELVSDIAAGYSDAKKRMEIAWRLRGISGPSAVRSFYDRVVHEITKRTSR